ncbi:MAG: hypothetical protein LC650_00030 [Actinobacteria bacterium]|nr:hypothetical protein [Actinomycetota bacterium]
MSEELEAKRDGAKLQKNSGRGVYQKADALLDYLSIDYKESEKSFTLNVKNWAKVCTDALKNGSDKEPVIKLILGSGIKKVRIAIVSWEYLLHLKETEELYIKMMEGE